MREAYIYVTFKLKRKIIILDRNMSVNILFYLVDKN